MASYEEEFKKRIVRMHLEEGRTLKSLSEEYHVSENGIGYWLKKYREECSSIIPSDLILSTMVLLHGRNAWLNLLGEGVTILIDENSNNQSGAIK